MKQKLIKMLWIILVCSVIVIAVTQRGTAKAINPNSERIAELSYDINELESHKNLCLDNLPYKESVDNANWIHTYCNMYDDIIMAYQEELEKLVADTSHERFKKLCEAYWLDASKIREVENHYWITESTILCITIAETSWGKRGAWWKNIWSVGSNDRWDRPTYALMEAWLEDIGRTLNNKYLWSIQTLWCLSNAWHCQSRDNNGHRYATSEKTWEKNMVACLSKVYWPVDPKVFNIRRR